MKKKFLFYCPPGLEIECDFCVYDKDNLYLYLYNSDHVLLGRLDMQLSSVRFTCNTDFNICFRVCDYININEEEEALEEINDSAAIQQEQSDSEKELIKEDFVSFEKELEEHKFLIIPFENEFKLTEELISIKGQAICDEYESEYCFDDLKLVFLDFLIYEFFPNSKIRLEEDKKSLHVETRLGTVFILRPVDWENRRCEYRYLHKYDISLCIF